MKKINYHVLALIVANLIWGAASPIFKFSLQNMPPFSLAFLRFLLACLIMYPFIHKKLAWSDLRNKSLWLFGLLGITINIGFFFLALEHTDSINAPIIGSTGPIIILIGSILFLKEKVKLHSIVGILLAFTGILIIILQPIINKGLDGAILGNLLLIIATFGSVGSTLIGKKILKADNFLAFTFWSFFIGVATFFPLMIREFIAQPTWLANLDYRGWIGILFGSILSSVVAYCLYNLALAKLPAFKVSVFAYMDPVVAILIAIPLLGEKITPVFIVGSTLVFLGILIAEKRLHWHPIHKIFNSNLE